jgi:hypothetical protein
MTMKPPIATLMQSANTGAAVPLKASVPAIIALAIALSGCFGGGTCTPHGTQGAYADWVEPGLYPQIRDHGLDGMPAVLDSGGLGITWANYTGIEFSNPEVSAAHYGDVKVWSVALDRSNVDGSSIASINIEIKTMGCPNPGALACTVPGNVSMDVGGPSPQARRALLDEFLMKVTTLDGSNRTRIENEVLAKAALTQDSEQGTAWRGHLPLKLSEFYAGLRTQNPSRPLGNPAPDWYFGFRYAFIYYDQVRDGNRTAHINLNSNDVVTWQYDSPSHTPRDEAQFKTEVTAILARNGFPHPTFKDLAFGPPACL